MQSGVRREGLNGVMDTWGRLVRLLFGGRGSVMMLMLVVIAAAVCGVAARSSVMVVVDILEQTLTDVQFNGTAMPSRVTLLYDAQYDDYDERRQEQQSEHRCRYPERRRRGLFYTRAHTASRRN